MSQWLELKKNQKIKLIMTNNNMNNGMRERFDERFSEIENALRADASICKHIRHDEIKDFIQQEIDRAIAEERERICKNIEVSPFDVQDVGDHYWGGDYVPENSELIRMAQIWTDKLKDLITKQ